MTPNDSLRRLTRSRRTKSPRPQVEALEERTVPSINMVEVESNNTVAAAQAISRVLDIDVIVDGDISGGDRDWFG